MERRDVGGIHQFVDRSDQFLFENIIRVLHEPTTITQRNHL